MSLDIWGRISVANCTCPKCEHEFVEFKEVFDFNITHNLSQMARESGCGILWDNAWGKQAWELITPIKTALENLKSNPVKFDKFNAENGWGTREQFIPWLEKLLAKCEEFPHAILGISK